MTFSFDTAAAQGAVIKVIGVGGGRIIKKNSMVAEGVSGVDLIAQKTAVQDLVLEDSLKLAVRLLKKAKK